MLHTHVLVSDDIAGCARGAALREAHCISQQQTDLKCIAHAQPVAGANASPCKHFWFQKSLLGGRAGTPCHFLFGAVSFVASIFVILLLSGFNHVDEFHQLLVIDRDDRWVVNGPNDQYILWWKETELREVELLTQGQYAIVSNLHHGTKAVRHGPSKLFLGAYEEVESINMAATLSQREYLVVENTMSGSRKVIRGSGGDSVTGRLYRPCPSPGNSESGRTMVQEDSSCAYEVTTQPQRALSASTTQRFHSMRRSGPAQCAAVSILPPPRVEARRGQLGGRAVQAAVR